MTKNTIIYIILLSLTSCLNSNTSKNKIGNNSNKLKTEIISEGDSILLPEFEIELKLSEKALEKINKDNESIIVQAYFSGIPTDTTNEDYIERGKMGISSEKIELFKNKIAKFYNVKISKQIYDELSDKNFEVLINVFSGRRKSSLNLLNSEILQKGINDIKGTRQSLKVKLIEGE